MYPCACLQILAIPMTTAVVSRLGFSFMLAMLTLGQLGWLAIHWTIIIPIDDPRDPQHQVLDGL